MDRWGRLDLMGRGGSRSEAGSGPSPPRRATRQTAPTPWPVRWSFPSSESSRGSGSRRVLRLAVARDNDNPFAWYQLGIVYDREGDEARASLATAERYSLEGNAALALPNAERAMMGIPVNTPDWLRAQDIAMTARAAVQRHGHH